MKEITKFVKSKKWYKMGKWKQPIFLASMTTHGMTNKKYGSDIPFAPSAYSNLSFCQYNLSSDYKRNIKDTIKLFKKDINKTIKKLKKEADITLRKLDNFNPKQLTAKTLRQYIHLVTYRPRQWYEIMLADGALSELYPQSLPPTFKIAEQTFTPAGLLTKTALPKKLFPMIEEQFSLLQMAIDSKSGKNIDPQLKKHAAKFSWMNSLCWWDEPFTKENYRQQAKKLAREEPEKKLEQIKKERNDRYKKAEKLLSELKRKFPQAYVYIDIIRDLTDLKEYNWDVVSLMGVRMRPLFKKLAKQYFLSYNQLLQLAPQEMIALLEKNKLPVAIETINERMKSFYIISRQGKKQKIISGDAVKKIEKIVASTPPNINELKGAPIWLGNISGRVRIINSPDEVHKMKEGEILVCPMSDPDYMPAIRKAKAIVADQGGLLCHAAIVARELHIPCIVGTEFATKVLKDDDLIEMNADTGIVKILKINLCPPE